MALAARRDRGRDRARARGDDRRDPRDDRPGGAGVRAPARGIVRTRRPDRRDRGAGAVRRTDPEPVRGARPGTRGVRGARQRRAARRVARWTPCSPPIAWARGSPGGGWPPPPRARASSPTSLSLLAESIFAYIETLSADSVEGYAEARARLEGERRRLRHELVGGARPRAARGRGRSASRSQRLWGGGCHAPPQRSRATRSTRSFGRAASGRRARRRAGRPGLRDRPRPRRAGPAWADRAGRRRRRDRRARRRWARPARPARSAPRGPWPAQPCAPLGRERSRPPASCAPTTCSPSFCSSKTPTSRSGSPRDGSRRSTALRPRPAGAWSRRRSRMCSNEGTPQRWRVPSACIRRRRATASAGFASCSETHWTTRTLVSR